MTVCIEINTCHTDGPRVFRELDFIIFVIQILLVLLNFFLLQYSVPCKMVDKPEHAYLLDVNGDRKDRNRTALKTKTRLGQGGRLGFLLWYFVGVTLVIIFLGLLAFFSGTVLAILCLSSDEGFCRSTRLEAESNILLVEYG